MCEMSTQIKEIIYWIHDKVVFCGTRFYAADFTRQFKLCTKLHNTDPDICDLWHAKSIYFRTTDTLRIQWPFPLHKVGVAFLIYESNQDRPCDFVMSCWQSCARARESVCPWLCSNGSTIIVPGSAKFRTLKKKPFCCVFNLMARVASFSQELSYSGTPSQPALSFSLLWHSSVMLCVSP